ncbi:hypothetical protein JCM8097_004923 [Rhodosporidiobolus ruineniae]
MSKVALLGSPPSSPSFGSPSQYAMNGVHPRSRFRPTLPTLAFVAFHVCLFLYYQHAWRQHASAQLSPTSSSSSSSSSASSSSFRSQYAALDPDTLLPNSTLPALATQSCELCHLEPDNPLCEYGLDNIRLSRSYEGSGHRLRRVLEKALRGEEIGVGIIGASVTQGHGLGPGEARWEDRFFEDFQRVFPTAKMHVGAIGAMDSRFFAYCFEALVPKDLDIYVLEVDLNNVAALDQLRDDDAVTRALLQLPQEPALIRVSTFAVLFDELAQGIISSLTTSAFHDVPVIGIRNWLLPHVIHHREAAEEIFGLDVWGNRDYRHISKIGHQALGDMLALFMRKEVCEAKRRAVLPPPSTFKSTGPWPTGEDLGRIPPLAIWSSWVRPKPLDPVQPMCQTAVSTLSPLKPHSYSSTFKLLEWNGKAAWGTSQPGSQIRFRFTGTKVGLFVWATNGLGADENVEDKRARRQHAPGKAMCWVEEPDISEEEWESKYGGTTTTEAQSWMVTSHFPEKAAAGPEFIELAEGLAPGNHILACEVISETTSGGNFWRVMGVASQ